MLNKKRIALIALAAVMTLGTVGCGGNPQLTEQLNLGEEYMTSGDYENAIAAYQSAIGVDKYAWDAHSGLVLAMVEGGKDQEEINAAISTAVAASMELAGTNVKGSDAEALVGFYETAMDATTNEVIILDVLIASNDVLKENPFNEEYVSKLETMIENLIEANNYDAAQDLIDRLKEVNPDADIAALEQQKEEKELADAGYVEVMKKAMDLIDATDWAGLVDLESTDELKALRERIGDVGNFNYTFTEGEHAGKTLGYYSMEGCDCNQWYYGDMVNGVRQGYGKWLWAYYNDGELCIQNFWGEWENDMPNGNGHLLTILGDVLFEDKDYTFVNGLANGTYELSSTGEDGYVWTATCTIENGRYVEVGVEDWVGQAAEGRYYYAVSYRDNGDGTSTARTWSTVDNYVKRVSHFGE